MPTPTEAALLAALQSVVDPNTGEDFVTTRQLRNLRIDGGDVAFDVQLGYPAQSQFPALRKALVAAARSVPPQWAVYGPGAAVFCRGPD